MVEYIEKRINHFIGVSDVDAFIFNLYNRQIAGCYCTSCCRCDEKNTHRYGAFEAQRWNGKYIYYCPIGLIFISVIINEDNDVCIAGPIIMGDIVDFFETASIMEITNIPNLSARKVNHCAELLYILFQDKENTQGKFLNGLYNIIDEIKVTENYKYPIDLEKKLQNAIINGDEQNSKEYLNLLLGHIFFSSNADIEIIKHRVIELVALLSRSAIEGGADVTQIFMLNTDNFLKIEAIKTIDELSFWLANIINRFISYVFEFVDVKHTDIMYKTVRYIKENYSKKLTLEIICKEVFLSKPYLSKIFKDEMNCSITNYINNVRIQKSKELLHDDSISIADIAGLVGFDDQSYFTKVFKKVEGVSPGKYRENKKRI